MSCCQSRKNAVVIKGTKPPEIAYVTKRAIGVIIVIENNVRKVFITQNERLFLLEYLINESRQYGHVKVPASGQGQR